MPFLSERTYPLEVSDSPWGVVVIDVSLRVLLRRDEFEVCERVIIDVTILVMNVHASRNLPMHGFPDVPME